MIAMALSLSAITHPLPLPAPRPSGGGGFQANAGLKATQPTAQTLRPSPSGLSLEREEGRRHAEEGVGGGWRDSSGRSERSPLGAPLTQVKDTQGKGWSEFLK